MKMKKLLFLGATALLSLVACNGSNAKEEGPLVFVLTGQSNMEGNTRFTENDLKKVFTDLEIADGDCCFEGIPEVQTSFFGCGYGQIYTSLSYLKPVMFHYLPSFVVWKMSLSLGSGRFF